VGKSSSKISNNSFLKTHYATRGVVNFYNAGVVTHDRRISSEVTVRRKGKYFTGE
jgi:hypothetical protein